ncbi:MAG: hypothetical protein K6F07_01840 [Bacilli bacterium]|nr:hypothetical protein [Bacilli bacterium]
MLRSHLFKKDNIDRLFDELAIKYESLGGNTKIDIYVVGGASIVLNFSYRMSTIDIDAYYQDSKLLKEAIAEVSKSNSLPPDWINQDFVKTPSYSPKLIEKGKMFAKYGQFLTVFYLEPKYLIAMKLKSSRPTGGDLDDIVMMIYELRFKNMPITYEEIIEAYEYLYSDYSNTYDYFLVKTKEAFETPIEDFEHLFK